ncbi:MAG: helix-turn-helix domain-containing protein [Proteobacteria bacterium]|nr:helix-turn-helix domain-containing protein [Pseudomonadota bacterium]
MDQQYDDIHGNAGVAEPQLSPRAKPDGQMDPAGEAGWYLEREREARGLSLDDAAHATGIHPYHIMAIEYGDMTHMPPRLEALEMIAAYASFLGFDPDPLLEHYISFLPQPELAPRHHPADPAPMSSAKVLLFGKFPKIPALNMKLPSMPGGRNGIVASVAAVLLLLTGTVFVLSVGSGDVQTGQAQTAQADGDADPMPTATTGTDAANVKVTETPAEESADAQLEESPVEASEEADVAMADGNDDLGAFISKQVDGAQEPAEVVASVAPLQQSVVQETPDGRIFGVPDPKARVMLKATRSIWLLIEDGQGNRIATQLLNKGDMYRVPSRPGLVAIAQDGGAIKYMIDGKERGVLGLPGTLLAAEPLDVAKLQAKG